MNNWWRKCFKCVGWGRVTGTCSHCNRCPYAQCGSNDMFVESENK